MQSPASSTFDAYYKWLGILPAEQPPNHYRLLGIALFEADPEVIAAAADRQMGHVKSFAAGQYAAQSQSLLNELARARVTLLNSRQKAEYDRRLQQLLAEAPSAQVPTPSSEPKEAPAGEASAELQELAGLNRVHSSAARIDRRRRQGHPALTFAIVAGLMAVAACLYYADALRPEPSEDSTETPTSAVAERPQADRPRQSPRGAEQEEAEQDQDSPSSELPPDVDVETPPIAPATDVRRRRRRRERPAADRTIDHVIDLDLENRRQRYPLSESTQQKLQVLALRGCEVPFEIKPEDGTLDDDANVRLLVNGVREVLIDVEITANSQGTRSIVLECHVVSDEGKDVPFTLPNLQNITRRIIRQGNEAASQLSDMDAEKAQLEAWLNAGGTKPLADVGVARRRIRELEGLISGQSESVQLLKADLEVAETLLGLATHLHEDCALEIGVVE
jgi:hypothetical protein